MTDDHVTGEAGGDAARLDHWRELEVELDPAAESKLLAKFDRALTRSGAHASPWPSKLRRLIGDWVPAPRRAGKKPDAGGIVLAYVGEQFDALRRADVGTRLDAEDSVHQLRVSARKLRAALRTFGSILDKEATAPVIAELRWLGGQLALARDTEVTEARLKEQLDDVPGELVFGPLRQYLTRYFAREAEKGRAQAAEVLSGKRYLALLRSLDALLDDPPLTAKARKPAKSGLRKPLRKAARKLRAAEAATHRLEGAELETALHEVRKKAKRARYAADAVSPVYGKKLRKWRKHVKAVQTALGKYQDTVVGKATLRRLVISGHADGQNTFTFGLLYGREVEAGARQHRRFASKWRKLRVGTRPGWLKG
jgi:CHAD domain-containing protein